MTVWPELAIFLKNWLIVAKIGDFWAILKSITIYEKLRRRLLENLGYFLFQHLVKLYKQLMSLNRGLHLRKYVSHHHHNLCCCCCWCEKAHLPHALWPLWSILKTLYARNLQLQRCIVSIFQVTTKTLVKLSLLIGLFDVNYIGLIENLQRLHLDYRGPLFPKFGSAHELICI